MTFFIQSNMYQVKVPSENPLSKGIMLPLKSMLIHENNYLHVPIHLEYTNVRISMLTP